MIAIRIEKIYIVDVSANRERRCNRAHAIPIEACFRLLSDISITFHSLFEDYRKSIHRPTLVAPNPRDT